VLQCVAVLIDEHGSRETGGIAGGLVCTFINDCADNRATEEARSECVELMRDFA
jgi:hypothetical protein